MNISSSSLFRFTTKFQYLKQIITEGFGFRPCTEEIAIGNYDDDPFAGLTKEVLHSHAICFCDLPMSASEEHRSQYGNYAIAMTKDWAMRNHVTPIRYYHHQSPDMGNQQTRLMLDMLVKASGNQDAIAGVLIEFLNESHRDFSKDDLRNLPPSATLLLRELNQFAADCLTHYWKTFNLTRVYQGEWADRTTGVLTNRRFYDEREWRAVAEDPTHRLLFQFDDVTRIIVSSAEESKELGELIESMAQQLGVQNTRDIWAKIDIGEKIYSDS